jgi:hypothetical protein
VLQHQKAIGSARTLRIHRARESWDGSLERLQAAGALDPQGGDPFAVGGSSCPEPDEARRHLVCDATIPVLPGAGHCLTVLRLEPVLAAPLAGSELAASSATVLFSVPLAEIENETCWFYPTDDGLYLAWEAIRPALFGPGLLPDQSVVAGQDAGECRPQDLRVLWSLMADDPELTCVGFTCGRRRIEFLPLASLPPATPTQARWSAFRVATETERVFQPLASIPAGID